MAVFEITVHIFSGQRRLLLAEHQAASCQTILIVCLQIFF